MTLRLNGSTSGYVELDAPAVAGTTSLTLPTGTGSAGQLLATDGAGALSFVNGGKILQVVQATKNTGFTTTSTSFVDITDLSVDITPTQATSKVLIYVTVSLGNSNSAQAAKLTIKRGSTNLAGAEGFGGTFTGTSSGRTIASVFYLDSPATTSSTTYTAAGAATGATAFYNQTGGGLAFTCAILAMEVAA